MLNVFSASQNNTQRVPTVCELRSRPDSAVRNRHIHSCSRAQLSRGGGMGIKTQLDARELFPTLPPRHKHAHVCVGRVGAQRQATLVQRMAVRQRLPPLRGRCTRSPRAATPPHQIPLVRLWTNTSACHGSSVLLGDSCLFVRLPPSMAGWYC